MAKQVEAKLDTFHGVLQDLSAEARSHFARVAHVGVAVDLDQPDREILHDHKVGAVKLEAVLPAIHSFLAGQ